MHGLGLSPKSALGKRMRLPLRLIPSSARMPILRGRMRGFRWIAGSSNHGCWLGTYDLHKQKLLESLLRPGDTVFDLGGHAGFYTLLASVLVGPTGRVFTIEPLPRNAFHIREHLRINGITNATVIEAAVSDAPGSLSFEEGEASTLGHISPHGTLTVRAVQIDALIRTGEVTKPDFIKIDVEGAENQALIGAKQLLSEVHPTLLIAFHGSQRRLDCLATLRAHGYDVQPIDGYPLDHCSEVLATHTAYQRTPR